MPDADANSTQVHASSQQVSRRGRGTREELLELRDELITALLKAAQGDKSLSPFLLKACRLFLADNGITLNVSGHTLATLAAPEVTSGQYLGRTRRTSAA